MFPSLFPVLYFGLQLRNRLQHVHREMLTVERVLAGVEQVSNDDGTVHDHSTGQADGIGHQCVHYRVCK